MQVGDFIAVENGGTGAITAAAATTNLLPSQLYNSGKVLSTDGNGNLSWIASTGTGTVTSINLTAPISGITITGGPITTSGSITLALADDLAAIEALTTIGIVRRISESVWSAGGNVDLTTEVMGALSITNGGTGQTTAILAFDALAPTQTSNNGKVLSTDGANTLWTTISALPSASTIGTGVGTIDLLFGATSIQRSGSTASSSITPVVIDTWIAANIRSAKYMIQIVDTVSGSVHTTELMVTHDNANNVYTMEYGTIASVAPLAALTAVYDGSMSVNITLTPASSNATQYKFSAIIIAA